MIRRVATFSIVEILKNIVKKCATRNSNISQNGFYLFIWRQTQMESGQLNLFPFPKKWARNKWFMM